MPVLQPPPFRVYLLRHARAALAIPGERDFDRHLDNTGFSEAELVADRAAEKGYRPDILLSSTAFRCRETAEAMRRAFNDTVEITYADEMYNGNAETYLALISAQADSRSVMLVGHNPTMEATLEAFIGHKRMDASLASGFPTAGLAVLDASQAGDEAEWQLIDFLAP